MKIIRYYLCSWGINTIGNWSDREFIRFARLPYVIPWTPFPKRAIHIRNTIFRDFPDVFSPEYEESASGMPTDLCRSSPILS